MWTNAEDWPRSTRAQHQLVFDEAQLARRHTHLKRTNGEGASAHAIRCNFELLLDNWRLQATKNLLHLQKSEGTE